MSVGDDCKMAFINAVNEILVLVEKMVLGRVNGVYDREMFEREYGLIWENAVGTNPQLPAHNSRQRLAN